MMIAPLMVSIFTDGLRSVKPGWLEGSLALGVNRWRTIWKIGVRTARPAIVAGTVLAVARAIGEAVMLAMISGSVAFAPNPADGLIFIYEPSRPLAPTIVKNIDQLSSPPSNATLFAIAAVLLFSAAIFSLAGWVARRSMRKYGATPDGAPPVATPPRPSSSRPGGAPPRTSSRPRARSRAAPPGALRPHRPGDLLGARPALLRDRGGDRRLPADPGDQVPEALDAGHPGRGRASAESETGGFSDALIGTLIVGMMGIAMALPIGVAIAVWLVEYGRPAGARPGHRDRRSRRSPASPRSCSPCSAR